MYKFINIQWGHVGIEWEKLLYIEKKNYTHFVFIMEMVELFWKLIKIWLFIYISYFKIDVYKIIEDLK